MTGSAAIPKRLQSPEADVLEAKPQAGSVPSLAAAMEACVPDLSAIKRSLSPSPSTTRRGSAESASPIHSTLSSLKEGFVDMFRVGNGITGLSKDMPQKTGFGAKAQEALASGKVFVGFGTHGLVTLGGHVRFLAVHATACKRGLCVCV